MSDQMHSMDIRTLEVLSQQLAELGRMMCDGTAETGVPPVDALIAGLHNGATEWLHATTTRKQPVGHDYDVAARTERIVEFQHHAGCIGCTD